MINKNKVGFDSTRENAKFGPEYVRINNNNNKELKDAKKEAGVVSTPREYLEKIEEYVKEYSGFKISTENGISLESKFKKITIGGKEYLSSEVAHNPEELNNNTRVWRGPFIKFDEDKKPKEEYRGILKILTNMESLEVIATSPDKIIQTIDNATISGESGKDLVEKIEKKDGANISPDSNFIHKSIKASKEEKNVGFIFLSGEDMGFDKTFTEEQKRERRDFLGLDKCQPKDALNTMLNNGDQIHDWTVVDMDPIENSNGSLSVFRFEIHNNSGLWLDSILAYPDDEWYLNVKFMFRLCKSES